MVLITFFLGTSHDPKVDQSLMIGMSSQNPVGTPKDRQKIIDNFSGEVKAHQG